jgi:hypothetical protein
MQPAPGVVHRPGGLRPPGVGMPTYLPTTPPKKKLSLGAQIILSAAIAAVIVVLLAIIISAMK